MPLEMGAIISFESDETNALSLFAPEELTPPAARTHVDHEGSRRAISVSAQTFAAPPVSQPRAQVPDVSDFDAVLKQAELQIKTLEQRTTHAFKRLQRAAQMEAVLEQQLEHLESACASHTGHMRHRLEPITAAGSRVVRSRWSAVVSRTTTIAKSYRQAAISRGAARTTRRQSIETWSGSHPSRRVIMIAIAVAAVIGATGTYRMRSGRPDVVLEASLNGNRSADRSTSPAESAPPLTHPADLIADPSPANDTHQPVLAPLAILSAAAPAPVPAAQAVVAPAAAPASAAPAAKVTVPNEAASDQGFDGVLEIITEPVGAKVFVDQRLVGESPVLVNKLRAGSHVIRVEGDGFERWSRAVPVPAGRQTVVNATLQPDSNP
jgi:hypothetical protein